MNISKEELKKPAVIGIFKKSHEDKPKKRVVVKDLRQQPDGQLQEAPPIQANSPTMQLQKSGADRQSVRQLHQVIEEYNRTEDELMKEYYSKRHLLLSMFSRKTVDNQCQPEVLRHGREKEKSRTTTILSSNPSNKNLTVIPIFAKVDRHQQDKSQAEPKRQTAFSDQRQNTIEYGMHHPTPNTNNNLSFRMKTDHCLNFTLGNSVGSDQELKQQVLQPSINNLMSENKDEESYESTEESFYSVYLKVQEDKLSQQRQTVMKLTSRVDKEEQQLDYIEVESAYGGSRMVVEDNQDWQQPAMKFAFMLAEAISVEQHRDILKNKLKYKMFEVFRLMGFTEFTITRRQFIDSLVRLMDQTNMQRQDMEHLSQLIFQGKLQITYEIQQIRREQFTSVFKCQKRVGGAKMSEKDELIEDDAHSLRSCNSRTEATMDYLRKFFADCNMLGYFQTKMRNLVKEKGGMVVSNLFNEISNSREFEQMDIFYYLHNKIKTSVEPTSIVLLLDRIMLRQKNGKFNKNDFYLWLTNR